MKVSMPNDVLDAGAKDGTMAETIGAILEELKPEAGHFLQMAGKRTGIIVVNIDEPSEIPAIAEPLFLGLGAAAELHPAMGPDDLMTAGPAIGAAAKKYG